MLWFAHDFGDLDQAHNSLTLEHTAEIRRCDAELDGVFTVSCSSRIVQTAVAGVPDAGRRRLARPIQPEVVTR